MFGNERYGNRFGKYEKKKKPGVQFHSVCVLENLCNDFVTINVHARFIIEVVYIDLREFGRNVRFQSALRMCSWFFCISYVKLVDSETCMIAERRQRQIRKIEWPSVSHARNGLRYTVFFNFFKLPIVYNRTTRFRAKITAGRVYVRR